MADKITLYTTDFKTGEKTPHVATSNKMRTATVKRIFSSIDIDGMIADSATPADLVNKLTMAVLAGYPIFEEELLTLFPDLTSEDLNERTTIDDVAGAITDMILFTVDTLGHIGDRIKKKVGLEA